MMSLWDALRMNMMISYQELVRTFLKEINEKIFSLLKNKLDGFNVLTHLMDQDEITIYILDGKLLINNFKSTPN
ncbi:hypothetical protein [Klebsiella pneumoniae]|uniref:hypothetical protein n=1 Tax=Klebsiella pneumoniae TaxID=573 RepID=UPI00209BF998|nr:hypothetical protein [Klebsiella pneumoniae]